MNLKVETTRLFNEINLNLQNQHLTKIALENAMRKPIHQAFKSAPSEHYRKLYREISRITHPDKIRQGASNSISVDPIVLFHSKIYTLAQALDSSERDAFLRTPQQLVENYKDRLPNVIELVELASHVTLRQLINKLKKAMLTTLIRDIRDSERYNIYIQWMIYSIQAMVNAAVVVAVAGLLLLSNLALVQLFILSILLSSPLSLASACLLTLGVYLGIRGIKDSLVITGLNTPLLFFIGVDALDKALKELMPISQLASDYRAHYKDEDEIEFTEEDSDETVFNYAREKLYTNSYDIECKRLRRDNIPNKPFWQYPQILLSGFFKAMQMTLPAEQSLASHRLSSEPELNYLLLHYKRERHQTSVFDMINTRVCYDSSVTPWVGFYHNTSNESVISSQSSRIINERDFEVVTKQGMNPDNLPIIHHIDHTLYSWNDTKQTLEQLTLNAAKQMQLPSHYIHSSDSIFYFDKINKNLHRLSFNEPQDSCSPKSQYILFDNTIFYYNNFTSVCNEIALEPGPMLDVFKEKFAYGTQIETLSADQLAFIKENTQHSNRSSQTLFICLKLLRAVCFIPFIITESILYLVDLALKAFAISLMYVVFAIKLSVTLLLNLPLYVYEACINPQNLPDTTSELNQDFTATTCRALA